MEEEAGPQEGRASLRGEALCGRLLALLGSAQPGRGQEAQQQALQGALSKVGQGGAGSASRRAARAAAATNRAAPVAAGPRQDRGLQLGAQAQGRPAAGAVSWLAQLGSSAGASPGRRGGRSRHA